MGCFTRSIRQFRCKQSLCLANSFSHTTWKVYSLTSHRSASWATQQPSSLRLWTWPLTVLQSSEVQDPSVTLWRLRMVRSSHFTLSQITLVWMFLLLRKCLVDWLPVACLLQDKVALQMYDRNCEGLHLSKLNRVQTYADTSLWKLNVGCTLSFQALRNLWSRMLCSSLYYSSSNLQTAVCFNTHLSLVRDTSILICLAICERASR